MSQAPNVCVTNVTPVDKLNGGTLRRILFRKTFETEFVRLEKGKNTMTGYTVHTGSTIKFSTSWDRIFSEADTSQKSKAVKKQASGSSIKITTKKGTKKAIANRSATPGKKKSVKKNVPTSVKKRG